MQLILEAVAEYIVVVVITGAIVLCSLFKAVVQIARSSGRERTRREIAAYVSQGSMTPEQGERLLRAGVEERSSTCEV